MGDRHAEKPAAVSQPLFVRAPQQCEVKAMADLMGVRVTMAFDGVTAVTVLSLLQRHQRDAGAINPRATQFAWALRDLIVQSAPELQNLIDGGWAGIPLDRKN